MIQGHFLPPFDNDSKMSDEEKMKLILNALDSNSHLVIALPTFDAVDCPSVAYLLGTYPSPSVVVDDNTNIDYSNFGNSGGIRGSGGNNVAQQNQQQMSISDAFGSLGDVEDLPLAPLEFNTPVLGDDDRNTLDEGEAEEEESAAAAIVQPQLVEEGGDEDDEDFGNFDSVQVEEEGQLPMPLNVEQSNVKDIEDEDSLGEFDHVEEEEGFTPSDGAANNAVSNQIDDDDIKTESSAEEVLEKEVEVQDESFGTFGDFNTDTDTTQGFVDKNIIEEDVSSALEGNVQTLPFENGSALGSSEPTMSVSDAFGSLVEQQQHDDEANTQSPPATELNDGSTDESFGDLNEAGLDEDEKTNNDDDDDEFDTSFGDEEKVESDPFPSVDDENNNIVERDENDNGDSNKLSVFDALVEVQDAPLPSLGAFSSLGSADNTTEQSQPDESVKIESEPEENIMLDGEADAHTSSPTNKHPVNEHPDSEEVEFTSDVDEFATIEDPMGTNTISSELDDADKTEDDNKLQLSVFDSLAGVEDKPLPPLASFASFNPANSGVDDLVPSEDAPQDDEFGDFEAPSFDTMPEETDKEATASSEDNLTPPFDMISQNHDVPLPSLDTFVPTTNTVDTNSIEPDNPTPPTLETHDASTAVVESTDFCAFQATGESSSGHVDDNEPPKPVSNDEDMIFGDLTNNANSLPEVTSKVDSFPATAEQVSDHLFGSSGITDEAAAPEPEQNNEKDSFGDFNAFAEASHHSDVVSSAPEPNHNNEEDASGDFNAFTEATAQDDGEEEDNVAQVATTEDDDFGDFEAFPSPFTPSTAIGQALDNQDFVQADPSPSVNIKKEEGTFGPFEASTSAQNNEPGSNNEDLNFGSFEDPSNILESTNGVELEANTDNLGADCFGDFSSFEEGSTQAADSNNEKGDLIEILQSKLGNEHVKLAKDWQHIITSTEKDLQRGNKIMEYISSSLSSNDRWHITKSRKLQEYLSSLGGCVRLIRLITATIGDLLCIDKDIEVQESTLSQWNNNAIVANAIVIEYLWNEIAAKAVENDIDLPKLESVVEIRSRPSTFDSLQVNHLCQLTLHVTVEEEGTCTQSSVMWNGKRYMACAANFCANRQLVL